MFAKDKRQIGKGTIEKTKHFQYKNNTVYNISKIQEGTLL